MTTEVIGLQETYPGAIEKPKTVAEALRLVGCEANRNFSSRTYTYECGLRLGTDTGERLVAGGWGDKFREAHQRHHSHMEAQSSWEIWRNVSPDGKLVWAWCECEKNVGGPERKRYFSERPNGQAEDIDNIYVQKPSAPVVAPSGVMESIPTEPDDRIEKIMALMEQQSEAMATQSATIADLTDKLAKATKVKRTRRPREKKVASA